MLEAQPAPSAEESGPPVWTAPGLAGSLPGLVHGFTARMPRQTDQELAATLGALVPTAAGPPVVLAQPHGPDLLEVAPDAPDVQYTAEGRAVPWVDGAWARLPTAALLIVKSADCVPVLAADPELGAYAALHAGWRGVAAGILPNLLATWQRRGSSLARVRLAFGPHIRQGSFEVQADCLAQFSQADLPGAVVEASGQTRLDLAHVLRTQAARAGVPAERIEDVALCTVAHADAAGRTPFASYRRSKRTGTAMGTNLSYIGIGLGA